MHEIDLDEEIIPSQWKEPYNCRRTENTILKFDKRETQNFPLIPEANAVSRGLVPEVNAMSKGLLLSKAPAKIPEVKEVAK